jgi:hypothetical protein
MFTSPLSSAAASFRSHEGHLTLSARAWCPLSCLPYYPAGPVIKRVHSGSSAPIKKGCPGYPRVSSEIHRSTTHPPEEELVEGRHESIWTLDVGQVAAVGDYRQGASPEASGGVLRLGLREYPVACPPNDERRDLQKRKTVHQNLALASRVNQGAEYGQVGFEVVWRSCQPALLSQPLARDASGRMREEQRRPPPGSLVGTD